MKITILGSGREIGATAFLLEIKDRRILLDAGFHPQKVGVVHAKNVSIESKHQEMTVIGVRFHPGQYQEIVLFAEHGQSFFVPEPVVLGETDTIKHGLFRPVDKLRKLQFAVVGPLIGVGMQVDNQLALAPLATSSLSLAAASSSDNN